MKGKIEFLMENDGTLEGAPCVKLKGVAQSNKVDGAYYYDDRGNKRSLFSGGLELTQLGDDMFYIIIPSSRKVFIIDQRGNCEPVSLFMADLEITTTEEGFIKIENPKGKFRYIDRLFQKSEQPTELGKALYQYDKENIKPEEVIDAYIKEAYKDDPEDVIANKVMKFILNEERARAIREIEGMKDVPAGYVEDFKSKIAGIEAYLEQEQKRLQNKEAAKKAISSISFDKNFLG